MAFSEAIKNQRFGSAGGRCECIFEGHGHIGRCNAELLTKNVGRKKPGAWEAHHYRIPEGEPGADDYFNCRIFCWPCHECTFS